MKVLWNDRRVSGPPGWFRVLVWLGCFLTLVPLCPSILASVRGNALLLLVHPDLEASDPVDDDDEEAPAKEMNHQHGSRLRLARLRLPFLDLGVLFLHEPLSCDSQP